MSIKNWPPCQYLGTRADLTAGRQIHYTSAYPGHRRPRSTVQQSAPTMGLVWERRQQDRMKTRIRDLRRQDLQRAAFDLLAESVFHRATLVKIASRLGLSRALVHL